MAKKPWVLDCFYWPGLNAAFSRKQISATVAWLSWFRSNRWPLLSGKGLKVCAKKLQHSAWAPAFKTI